MHVSSVPMAIIIIVQNTAVRPYDCLRVDMGDSSPLFCLLCMLLR